MNYAETKQQAHGLIERLNPGQVATAVDVLESMLDPYERALANAPIDDEPVSEEERREILAARASFDRGDGIPNEDVLAEFGLTAEDFEHMGRIPFEPDGERT